MPNLQTNIDFKPTQKQFLAYEYLTDDTTTELLFGGSISSGKSRLACYWLILMCLKYQGTRYLLGRARLKTLKHTTLKTLTDILKEWGLESQVHHNKKDDIITFSNGSEIILMDLFQNPSDPDFVKLGSLELTGAVVDEAAEISETVYKTIKTRLRYKLKEHGLKPKLLIASNPSKGWLYDIFYKPSIEGTLPPHRKFIQSFPSDNSYNSQAYLDTLTVESLGVAIFNRLVLGDWDYNDSDLALFDFMSIEAAFSRQPQTGFGSRYISIDPAAQGKDSTVITIWQGWHVLDVIQIENSDTMQTVNTVLGLCSTHNVHISNVVVDKVGIGQGVFDLLKGCKGFIANATAMKSEPYKSLKDQCYYKLAKVFKEGKISFAPSTVGFKTEISQELEAHMMFNLDSDGKAQVTPKKIVKQMISRSPDFADSLIMRAAFDYVDIGKITILR